MTSRLVTIITFLLLVSTALLTACGGESAETSSSEIKLAPKSALPDFVQDAPPQVQEAYQFAIANPEILKQMPCYCGCGGVGHQNNLDCYIAEVAPDGSVARFDNHAFG
jgi:hypothetical protein